MNNVMTSIRKEVAEIIRPSIGPIFTTHVTYAALGILLFSPLAGIVGQLLLRLSGLPALADQDIAWFLVTPLGMAALILFATLMIAILAYEQASLIAISAGALQGLHVGTMQALYFTARRAGRILSFTTRLVTRVLLIILPFIATGAAIAWFLITDYDINYYLTEKPPVFLLAATLVALVLLTMLVALVHKLLAWSLALPMILFTDVSPAFSFAQSEDLTQEHKREILTGFAIWALIALLLGVAVLGSIQFLGAGLVPRFFDSINWLVFVLGGLVVLWSLGNLLITAFTSGSFACLLMAFYKRYGPNINTSDLAGNLRDLR